MSQNLKLCPFCGSSEIETFGIGSMWFAQCAKCETEQAARSEAEAIAAWNTRKGAEYWTIAVVTAWLREQGGHGEWREAADAIDREFLERPLND